ncbi:hypothetical protein H5410_044662 [Solanum commersonii]|uniref:Uncharacterized protein n=1 Tax=Solanum commersonii TaxID=4109 RepID=A0A9J5XAJ4_SOLCO|nr:hypothetical protein H5410_044662 [Solanum commersonii]
MWINIRALESIVFSCRLILIVNHDLLADYGSWPLCDESARSSRMSFHELAFDDLSNRPRAEEQVALTIASVERLILPTSIPKT